jgi:transcription antitermination factor NusG
MPSKAPTPVRKRRPRKPGPVWALIRTKHNQENYARVNCERQGYTVFAPRWQPAGRGKLKAWLPGYLFVLMDGMPWAPLRSTYGVLDVVPGIVPLKELRRIKAMMDGEGIVRTPEQHEAADVDRRRATKLSPGDAVTPIRGAFKNVAAVYKGVTPDRRIDVILSLMGHDVITTMDRADVAALPKSRPD